jgi:hypothetical protein
LDTVYSHGSLAPSVIDTRSQYGHVSYTVANVYITALTTKVCVTSRLSRGTAVIRLIGSLPRTLLLEFIGESYRFRQRLRQEEQPSFEGKTETG